MCSCWDRWGSCPSFEVPAKEVVASRGLSTPLCKIFRTESHWATSLPSVSLQTTLGFSAARLLVSSKHLTKNKNLTNVYKFTTVQRQWKTAWGLSRRADKNSGDLIYEREEDWERRGGCGNQPPTPPLNPSWSITIWIVRCPLYCCWQIITNWIPQLSYHTVKDDLILLQIYLVVNQFRLQYCAIDQRESLIITLITWSKRVRERKEDEGGRNIEGSIEICQEIHKNLTNKLSYNLFI